MQNYHDLQNTEAANVYLDKVKDNIQTVASNFSGTSFPTDNLQAGMLCYRTDKKKLYQLTDTDPITWESVQSSLTFDSAPTAGSTNPVTSGGIKTALDGKLSLSGGTMTGTLNLKNDTWNLAGDDAYFGDNDLAGAFCVKGANYNTKLALVNRSNEKDKATLEYTGGNLIINKPLECGTRINGVRFGGSDVQAPWSMNRTAQEIDLTSSTYDQDTWYPVVIQSAQICVIMEYVCYAWLEHSRARPKWGTHNSANNVGGFSTIVDVCVRSSRWGEYIGKYYVKHNTNSFCKNNVPPAIFKIDSKYVTGAVWYLRGGGIYNLFTSDTVTWRVVTEKTLINGGNVLGNNAQYVEPTKTQPTPDITNMMVTSDMLKTVATSGSYNDLTNKPTIPTKTSQLTNDSYFLNKEAAINLLKTITLEELL